MALIEVRDLRKRYDDGTEALRGVSFSVAAGEFIAIMGPSGSGKSTLLHLLGFLDQQSSGEYRFDGKTITDYTPNELAKIRNEQLGFVFQMFNLLPAQTVLENVMLPLCYSKVPPSLWQERALAQIKAVGLLHRKDHLAVKLSGGEKQRVAIARALINRPKIVFADEPTGNLDSRSGEAVMEILEGLHRSATTVVLITHETQTAEHAARIIHIRDGAILRDEQVSNRRSAKEFMK